MSLLMDVLRKLRDRERGSAVYPLLRSQRGRKMLTRRDLLMLGIFFTIGMTGTYIISELFLIEKTPEERGIVSPKKEEVKPPPSKVKEEEPPPAELREEKKEPPRSEERKKESRKESRTPPPRKTTDAKVKGQEGEDPRRLVLIADDLFRKGRLRESMEFYQRALSLNPSKDVANNLLVIYARLGLYTRAEDLLRRFPEEELVYSYAVELAGKGKIPEALSVAERFLSVDRKGLVHFAVGYARERAGELEEALKSYREAYRKDPQNPYFAANLARLLEATGDRETAYRLYRHLTGLQLTPELRTLVEERLSYLASLVR